MSNVKRACITALCTALCYVLPLAFHALGLGSAFSPMHLPVLLCGILCSWQYGLFCGIAGPLVSCLLSGMPSAAQLIYMIPELMVYGAVSGLIMKTKFIKNGYIRMYFALITAMVAGRAVGGACQAAFYLYSAREYSIAIWATAYIIGTLPGTVLQLILIPGLTAVLNKTGLVPALRGK